MVSEGPVQVRLAVATESGAVLWRTEHAHIMTTRKSGERYRSDWEDSAGRIHTQ